MALPLGNCPIPAVAQLALKVHRPGRSRAPAMGLVPIFFVATGGAEVAPGFRTVR